MGIKTFTFESQIEELGDDAVFEVTGTAEIYAADESGGPSAQNITIESAELYGEVVAIDLVAIKGKHGEFVSLRAVFTADAEDLAADPASSLSQSLFDE